MHIGVDHGVVKGGGGGGGGGGGYSDEKTPASGQFPGPR